MEQSTVRTVVLWRWVGGEDGVGGGRAPKREELQVTIAINIRLLYGYYRARVGDARPNVREERWWAMCV